MPRSASRLRTAETRLSTRYSVADASTRRCRAAESVRRNRTGRGDPGVRERRDGSRRGRLAPGEFRLRNARRATQVGAPRHPAPSRLPRVSPSHREPPGSLGRARRTAPTSVSPSHRPRQPFAPTSASMSHRRTSVRRTDERQPRRSSRPLPREKRSLPIRSRRVARRVSVSRGDRNRAGSVREFRDR